MKYFFDTEFAEDGKNITLISIGIVAEDGRELYLCHDGYDLRCRPNRWVQENVIPKLPPVNDPRWQPKHEIREQVRAFCGNPRAIRGGHAPVPEFWAYYGSYDWIVMCQLFGTMADMPDGWPFFCLDLKQYAYHLGIRNVPLDQYVPQDPKSQHDALADARWNKRVYDYLAAASSALHA